MSVDGRKIVVATLLTLFYGMWWWFPDERPIAEYPEHGLAKLFATRSRGAANPLDGMFWRRWLAFYNTKG